MAVIMGRMLVLPSRSASSIPGQVCIGTMSGADAALSAVDGYGSDAGSSGPSRERWVQVTAVFVCWAPLVAC